MSDEESQRDSNDSESSSSDDDINPTEWSEEFEKNFFKALSYLKNKDPAIYNDNVRFFQEPIDITSKSKSKDPESKPMFLKDFERKRILEEDDAADNEEEIDIEENDNIPTYTQEQQDIKDSFKKVLNDCSSDEDDSNTGLLKSKIKTSEEKDKEDSDFIQWLKGQKQEIDDKITESNLKPLREYWNQENLDDGEEFLKDYILNKRFLDNYSDEDNQENLLLEDKQALQEQDEYETNYNFRFENDEDIIKRYPRQIEGSLRRKDDKRRRKRLEAKERKRLEKEKKKGEISRLKNLKQKEIEQKINELQQLTGNKDLKFEGTGILDDEFDPDDYDKQMSSVFNEDYYKVDDTEKPEFTELGEEFYYEDDNFDDTADFNMDCDADLSSKLNETRSKRKRVKKKKISFDDLITTKKPIYDPTVHDTFEKYMDEYYSLDCEDFIEDVPCRFKYRKVEPNDFGLTVEEILQADDSELNRWSSMMKIFKIRPRNVEKNEVKAYKIKAQNEALKQKILPSLYKREEEDELDIENKDLEHSNENIEKNKRNHCETEEVNKNKIKKIEQERDRKNDENKGDNQRHENLEKNAARNKRKHAKVETEDIKEENQKKKVKKIKQTLNESTNMNRSELNKKESDEDLDKFGNEKQADEKSQINFDGLTRKQKRNIKNRERKKRIKQIFNVKKVDNKIKAKLSNNFIDLTKSRLKAYGLSTKKIKKMQYGNK